MSAGRRHFVSTISVDISVLQIIKYFSHRQRLHLYGLYSNTYNGSTWEQHTRACNYVADPTANGMKWQICPDFKHNKLVFDYSIVTH